MSPWANARVMGDQQCPCAPARRTPGGLHERGRLRRRKGTKEKQWSTTQGQNCDDGSNRIQQTPKDTRQNNTALQHSNTVMGERTRPAQTNVHQGPVQCTQPSQESHLSASSEQAASRGDHYVRKLPTICGHYPLIGHQREQRLRELIGRPRPLLLPHTVKGGTVCGVSPMCMLEDLGRTTIMPGPRA